MFASLGCLLPFVQRSSVELSASHTVVTMTYYFSDDDSDIDDEAQLVMDDNETDSSSLYDHISTEKRTDDKQNVLELRKNKRTRALERRAMQKHRSVRHPHVESLDQKEAEEAANVLAARDAALATATQVMEAQGVTPDARDAQHGFRG